MRVFFFELSAASGLTATIAADPAEITTRMTGGWAVNNLLVNDGAYRSPFQE